MWQKKDNLQCFHSKEWGHIHKHCPTYKKTNGAANIVVTSAANFDSEFLALVSELFDEAWVLDPGSSYHVTSDKEWLATYKPSDFGVVYQVNLMMRSTYYGHGKYQYQYSR
jgi:hypothetical protein